jgi:inner membrane protein
MEINQNHKPEPAQAQGFFQSTTAKIIMVGVLTLILLIPLQYVKSLISERSELQEQVSREIAQKSGGSVYFYGPVLKVPYRIVREIPYTDTATKKVAYKTSSYTEYAYFFPNELKADANVQTEPKYRNNYESAVFNAKMNFKGNYTSPNFASQNIAPENVQWEKASIIVQTNNLKSIKGSVNIALNGKNYSFEPVAKDNEQDSINTLETPAINLKDAFTGAVPFSLDVDYGGSEHLSIVPIGKLTEAKMTSNWHTPKFDGNFLPEKKTITDGGFTSFWRVSHLNRPFVQQYFEDLPDLGKYSFDVGFLIPVDEYQKNERASKYGFLVIGLTFLIFFLIQTISKISIHIFQYTMIGLALIMFYTLLISITEHSSFRLAYIIAGISVVVMITLYSMSILKNLKFPLLIAASLTGLYAFIYVIIQLESYALLAGSIGIFLILGAVMYFSRKIDWNSPAAIAR